MPVQTSGAQRASSTDHSAWWRSRSSPGARRPRRSRATPAPRPPPRSRWSSSSARSDRALPSTSRARRSYATLARAYGATVNEIYSPNATWSKVKAAAEGANIVIYLGHGNGYPSPYGAFYADRKDGLGLNTSAGHGNNNNKYYGETYVKTLKLQKNAVVILNRLCYAAGNSEWGRANPTKSTAKKRVDNYGAGFLRRRPGRSSPTGSTAISSIIRSLLTTDRTIAAIFMADPAWIGTRDFKFASTRTSGYTAWMDPVRAAGTTTR